MFILASFWKPEACSQTVLPDRSVWIGQKLVKNAKSKKFKCDILSNFQTMCKIRLTCIGFGILSASVLWKDEAWGHNWNFSELCSGGTIRNSSCPRVTTQQIFTVTHPLVDIVDIDSTNAKHIKKRARNIHKAFYRSSNFRNV